MAQAERALRYGLLQAYLAYDESSQVLRGQLRESDQMRRHRGQVIRWRSGNWRA